MNGLLDPKDDMRKRTGRRDHAAPLTILGALLLLVPLMLATPATTSAYTDPGTGAFMYQAAYAAFLGGSFYLRKLLDRIWTSRKKSSPRITSD